MNNEQLVRITKARWMRWYRSEKFIYNYLIRKRIPLVGNVCPYVKQANNKILLKDFKPVGQGGIGLVWGCTLCANCSNSWAKMSGASSPPSFSFGGSCRMSGVRGDANKIIIVPAVERNGVPLTLMHMDEAINDGTQILRRSGLHVISYTTKTESKHS